MLFDVISPIVFAADLLPVGSPFDVELTHRLVQRGTTHSPNSRVVRFIAGALDRLPDNPISLIAKHRNLQHAEDFTSQIWLVQDRDDGDSWYQVCAAIPGRE